MEDPVTDSAFVGNAQQKEWQLSLNHKPREVMSNPSLATPSSTSSSGVMNNIIKHSTHVQFIITNMNANSDLTKLQELNTLRRLICLLSGSQGRYRYGEIGLKQWLSFQFLPFLYFFQHLHERTWEGCRIGYTTRWRDTFSMSDKLSSPRWSIVNLCIYEQH